LRSLLSPSLNGLCRGNLLTLLLEFAELHSFDVPIPECNCENRLAGNANPRNEVAFLELSPMLGQNLTRQAQPSFFARLTEKWAHNIVSDSDGV